jgi:hypothetical protein
MSEARLILDPNHPRRHPVAHPHRNVPCSLTDDRFGTLYVTEVSADFDIEDFGPGVVEVACPCGAWVVEDESGAAIARSEDQPSPLAFRELAGAA